VSVRRRREKGYVRGNRSFRAASSIRGVGGGLCQLANLLYWMALHTPLKVTERHHHSFDPFPDEETALFPSAAVPEFFYNYIDPALSSIRRSLTFQIKVWLTEDHLKGGVYSDVEPANSYHLFEKNHRFWPMAVRIIARKRLAKMSSIAAPANNIA
jgi:vancomycin resistance protein VanW